MKAHELSIYVIRFLTFIVPCVKKIATIHVVLDDMLLDKTNFVQHELNNSSFKLAQHLTHKIFEKSKNSPHPQQKLEARFRDSLIGI
jgi:nitrate/TMAO reductase-like tetraheme cytochrome c subunit